MGEILAQILAKGEILVGENMRTMSHNIKYLSNTSIDEMQVFQREKWEKIGIYNNIIINIINNNKYLYIFITTLTYAFTPFFTLCLHIARASITSFYFTADSIASDWGTDYAI